MHFTVLVIGEDYERNLDRYENIEWDFYKLGGRFRGELLLKNGKNRYGVLGEPGNFNNPPLFNDGVDQARICDIDWKRMKKLGIERESKYYDGEALVSLLTVLFGWVDTDPDIDRPYGIFRKDIPEREEYIEDASCFSTFAVITQNGRWINSENYYEENEWCKNFFDTFLKDLDPNTVVTVVDCHS